MDSVLHLLTVKQLQGELHKNNLPINGLKSDLIGRLRNFLSTDEDVEQMDEYNDDVTIQNFHCDPTVEIIENADDAELSISNNYVAGTTQNVAESVSYDSTKEFSKREMDLLRRECELLEREKKILKKTNEDLERKLCGSSNKNSSENISLRDIANFIPEFNGVNDSFRSWVNQIITVQNAYSIENNQLKLVIIGKFKDKALNWFHSKSEHIHYTMQELLENMSRIFDTRPNKLFSRREFEARKWQYNESFAMYYNDKIVLANKVPIANDELVEYLIDGLESSILQSQARIQCFKFPEEMLEAFSNIAKEDRSAPLRSRNTETIKRELRCFNCNTVGHHISKCNKPIRPKGSCFECGSLDHLLKGCPKRNGQTATLESTPINIVTSNVCKVRSIPAYLFNLNLKFEDTFYSINSLIDTGSPISLIKYNIIPDKQLITKIPDQSFFGINGSRLDILGHFETDIEINENIFRMIFRVVPDNTMTYDCLLGRNFTTIPGIKIIFGKELNIEIVKDELITNENEIMNIEYENANSNIDLNVSKTKPYYNQLYKLFNDSYLNANKPEIPKNNYEMKIEITKLNHQPFYYSRNKLSFSEKETVSKIISELLRDGVIRKSFSPYSSRIVLIKKKNGETRMCIDFRELNKITVRDRYPLPLIEDHLNELRNRKYFTAIDLKNAFFHM